MTQSHTPTPWTYREAIILGSTRKQWVVEDADKERTICGQILNEENAAHIVRCINSHDALVEALNDAIQAIDTHIVAYPMAKTKLPELRAKLANTLNQAKGGAK